MAISKWVYLAMGEDLTGKTTFQKILFRELCNQNYASLPSNKKLPIDSGTNDLYAMGRSYQEKIKDYQSISGYFQEFDKQKGDVCILSSHILPYTHNGTTHQAINDISAMLMECRNRYYNVAGVFFENSITKHKNENTSLSLNINWDERIVIPNPLTNDEKMIEQQLELAGVYFAKMIRKRLKIN